MRYVTPLTGNVREQLERSDRRTPWRRHMDRGLAWLEHVGAQRAQLHFEGNGSAHWTQNVWLLKDEAWKSATVLLSKVSVKPLANGRRRKRAARLLTDSTVDRFEAVHDEAEQLAKHVRAGLLQFRQACLLSKPSAKDE